MKRNHHNDRLAPRTRVLACLSLILASSLHAVQFTWDTNGSSAGTGGTGDWDTSKTNWNNGTTTWPTTGTDNDAVFGGTAGTVTVQAPGIAVNDITVSTTGYLIQGGLVTITNAARWTVDTDMHVTLSAPVQQTKFLFYKSGRGTLEFANGCSTWSAADDNQLFSITNGTVLVSGGLFGGATGSRRIRIGNNVNFGAMRQTGGIAHFGNNDGQWMVGPQNIYGYYGLEGGTLTSTNGNSSLAFRFGVRTGAMYQSGGAIIVNLGPSDRNQCFMIGTDSTGGGATIVATNGTASIVTASGKTQMAIGVGAKVGGGGVYGQLTLDGSADWEATGYTQVGYPGAYSGALNLNGSSRLTSSYLSGATNGFLAFNGGTLRANYSTASFVQGFANAQINANGATIDTQNYDITIPQSLLAPTGNGVINIVLTSGGTGYLGAPVVKLSGGGGFGATAIAEWNSATKTVTGIKVTNPGSGYTSAPTVAFSANSGGFLTSATLGTVSTGPVTSGGLTKKGSGTLTLTGTNTYTGATAVQAGTLVIQPASLPVTASPTVSDGATLQVRSSASETVTLNGLTLGSATGASLDFSTVSSTNTPALTVSSCTLGGTATINILSGTFVRGSTYPLVAYTTLSGTFVLGSMPLGVSGTLSDDTVNKVINLTITGATVTWNGNIDGSWDINTTANWMNELDMPGFVYMDLSSPDSVRFDDSASGETNLSLAVTVSPTDVVFENSAKTYTLSGSGKISGATSLTKLGTKSVTLATDNDYTGTTTLSAGTLQVGSIGGTSGSLGSGAIINNANLYLDRGNSFLFTNALSGNGVTAIRYGGSMTLSGSAKTNLGWRVSQGSLTLPSGSALTVLTGNLFLSDRSNSGYPFAPTTLVSSVTVEAGASLTANAIIAGEGAAITGGSLTSTFTQNGGFVTTTGYTDEGNGIRLAHWGQANSTYNMNGGTLTVGQNWDLCLATDGTGTLHQVGGDIYTKRLMVKERNNTAGRGNLKVSGGTLHLGTQTGSMLISSNGIACDQPSTNYYSVELSGGTIKAYADLQVSTAATLPGPAAMTFDNNGFAVTVSGPLSGDGGVTKIGAGTLTLSAPNTYSGTTAINAGKLATTTASTGAGAFTLADGTALDVSISTEGQLPMSSLTLGTAANTTLSLVNISSTTTPPVNVAGDVAVGGTSTIQIVYNSPINTTNYPLIQYGSLSGSGTFVLGPMPQGVQATLSTNEVEKIIYLTVASIDPLVWNGNNGEIWDINTTPNWKNSSAISLRYQESPSPNTIRFDDTATGSGAVTLNTMVVPTGMTVDNSSKNYTITGSGGISGLTPLVKTGSGTLILATANSYAGPTTINSGTLQVGAGGTTGTLGSAAIINNGVLSYNRSDNQTWAQTISGTGSLTKGGPNDTSTLTLATPNTYSGGTTIAKGILQVNNSSAIGSGPLAIAGGRRMLLGSGVILTNVISVGSNAGETGYGLIHATAGTPEIRGPVTITAGAAAGGHFASASGAELLLKGAITSETATVSFREGAATFSGGGSYTNMVTSGTIRLGAANGLATNALVRIASSEAGLLNLNGFSQTLAGVTRADVASSLTNSSATTVTLTLNTPAGMSSTFASPVIGKINLTKWGAGEQTFSGTTNSINQIDIKQGSLALNGDWVNTGKFNVGGDTPNMSTLSLLGGSLVLPGVECLVGDKDIGLTGQVIHANAALTSSGSIRMSTYTNAAWASYTMSGGSINLTSTVNSYLLVGRNGQGTFNQSGGTVTIARAKTGAVTESALIIAFDTTSVGTYTLSGGMLTVTNGGYGAVIGINAGSQGALNITNTGIANLQSTILANATGANGTINMHGGELRFNTLKAGTGNRTFNWRAGTLRPLTSNRVARIESTLPLTLASSNAVFATRDAFNNEATLVVDSVIGEQGGSFGFEKAEEGNLLLTKTNTYSGPTVVTLGTLYANNTTGSATGSGTVTVRPGAVLGGTGSCTGAVTVAAGGGLNPGTTNTTPSTLTVGSLTFQPNTTNTLDCVVATVACDKVAVTGELALQGPGHIALSYTGEIPPSRMLIGTFASVSGAENLSAWTVSGAGINPAIHKYKVFIEGSSLYVGDRRGTMIMFR